MATALADEQRLDERELMSMSEEKADDEAATTGAIHALLAEGSDGEALTADGFGKAILGTAEGWFGTSHHVVALYDLVRWQEILTEAGMGEDEAVEWLEFNVTGAYVGSFTPVFAVINRQPIITPLLG